MATDEEIVIFENAVNRDRANNGIYYSVLSLKQAEIMLKALDNDTNIIIGGNRSTKTNLLCLWLVCLAGGIWLKGYKPITLANGNQACEPYWERDDRLPPSANLWLSCLDDNLLKAPMGIYQQLETYLPRTWISKTLNRRRGIVDSIFLKNGSVIQTKSAESGASKYQSAALDGIAIDEEHPKDIWDEINSRSGSKSTKILYAYYPRYGMDWTYKEFYEPYSRGVKLKNTAIYTMSYLDNPFIANKEKAIQIQKWKNDPMSQSRIDGVYTSTVGLVYYAFDRDKHVKRAMDIPEFIANRGLPPKEWEHYVIIDAHNSEKGCSALFMALAPNGRRYYWKEYRSNDTPNQWGLDIKNMLDTAKIVPERIIIDPSCNARDVYGFSIANILRETIGMYIDIAKRSHEEGIFACLSALQPMVNSDGVQIDGMPGAIFLEECSQAISEIEGYSRDKMAKIVKKNDEFPDCWRYAEIENFQRLNLMVNQQKNIDMLQAFNEDIIKSSAFFQPIE